MRLDFIDLLPDAILQPQFMLQKILKGVTLSDFEKSVNFSFIHAWDPPACVNHTQSQLFRRNPGMRNITQKLLTRYIFRSCISAACKKVLLRNLVYPNHKRYKTILTGTFKLGRFLLLKGRTPCCSNFIEVQQKTLTRKRSFLTVKVISIPQRDSCIPPVPVRKKKMSQFLFNGSRSKIPSPRRYMEEKQKTQIFCHAGQKLVFK